MFKKLSYILAGFVALAIVAPQPSDAIMGRSPAEIEKLEKDVKTAHDSYVKAKKAHGAKDHLTMLAFAHLAEKCDKNCTRLNCHLKNAEGRLHGKECRDRCPFKKTVNCYEKAGLTAKPPKGMKMDPNGVPVETKKTEAAGGLAAVRTARAEAKAKKEAEAAAAAEAGGDTGDTGGDTGDTSGGDAGDGQEGQ